MAYLQYGPIAFGLSGLASTLDYSRQPIIEGGNYVKTKYSFHVRGYANPLSMSYASTANPNTPTLAFGNAPVLTDTAIRHILSQPRQQLIYVAGGAITVVSPLPGFAVDAGLGPFCEVQNIIPSLGEFKTWFVEATITTEINECLLPTGLNSIATLAQRIITANLWSMHHTVDCDGICRIVWNGRTTLRTDLLLQSTAGNPPRRMLPDDLRPFILPTSVPTNCRRELVEVEQLDTPDQYRWRVVDQELVSNVRGQGVTRVKASQTARIVRKDRFETLWEGWNTLADWTARSFQEAARDAIVGNVAASGAGALAVAGRGLVAGSRFIQSNIPKVEISVDIGVWGRRDCSRKTLERFAYDLANVRFTMAFGIPLGVIVIPIPVAPPGVVLPPLPLPVGTPTRQLAGQSVQLTHDLAEERYVGLRATMYSSISGFGFALEGLAAGNVADLGSYFPDTDDTAFVFNGAPAGIFNADMPGLGLVNDRGTRGSLVQSMIYAVLANPCDPTLPPPNLTPTVPTSLQVGPQQTPIPASPTEITLPPPVQPVQPLPSSAIQSIIKGVLQGAGLSPGPSSLQQ